MLNPVRYTDSDGKERLIEQFVSISIDKNGNVVKTSSGEAAGLVVVASEPTRDIIDNNADGFTYFGSAPFGSAEADAVWVVERQANTSPDEFVSSAPNQIWDDRITVEYNAGVA